MIKTRKRASTYGGGQTNDSPIGTIGVDVVATRVGVLANQTNILISRFGVAVKDLPPGSGSQVGDASLRARLRPCYALISAPFRTQDARR